MTKPKYVCDVCGEKFLSDIELTAHLNGCRTKVETAKPDQDETTVEKVENTVRRTHRGYRGQRSVNRSA